LKFEIDRHVLVNPLSMLM